MKSFDQNGVKTSTETILNLISPHALKSPDGVLHGLMACLDTLRPCQSFFCQVRTFKFTGLNQCYTKDKLAQEHYTVPPVRLGPGTPHFQVKHPTTETLYFSLVYSGL